MFQALGRQFFVSSSCLPFQNRGRIFQLIPFNFKLCMLNYWITLIAENSSFFFFISLQKLPSMGHMISHEISNPICLENDKQKNFTLCHLLNSASAFNVQRALSLPYLPGPICSKHRKLNKLVSGQNVNCSSKYNIKFTGIFAEKMWVLTFFQQKY